jgi:hypothetical protein
MSTKVIKEVIKRVFVLEQEMSAKQSSYQLSYTSEYEDHDFELFLDDWNQLCELVLGQKPYDVYAMGFNLNWRGASGDMRKKFSDATTMLRELVGHYRADLVGCNVKTNDNGVSFIEIEAYHHDSVHTGGPTRIELYNADEYSGKNNTETPIEEIAVKSDNSETSPSDVRKGDRVKISKSAIKNSPNYIPAWGSLIAKIVKKSVDNMPYVSDVSGNNVYICESPNASFIGVAEIPLNSIVSVKRDENNIQEALHTLPHYAAEKNPVTVQTRKDYSDANLENIPIDIIGDIKSFKNGELYTCYRWKYPDGRWVYNAFPKNSNEKVSHTGYFSADYIFKIKGVYDGVKSALEKRKGKADVFSEGRKCGTTILRVI